MGSWIRTHWKKLAGAACGVVVVVLEPSQPGMAAALGTLCGAAFASDYHASETLARVGKDVIEELRKNRAPKKKP